MKILDPLTIPPKQLIWGCALRLSGNKSRSAAESGSPLARRPCLFSRRSKNKSFETSLWPAPSARSKRSASALSAKSCSAQSCRHLSLEWHNPTIGTRFINKGSVLTSGLCPTPTVIAQGNRRKPRGIGNPCCLCNGK